MAEDDRLKERLQVLLGERGEDIDRAVTLRDLQLLGLDVAGVDKIRQGKAAGPVYDLSESRADRTPPAAPRNLVVQNAFVANTLTWDNPHDDDLYFIEVWRSPTSSRDDAEKIAVVTIPPDRRGLGGQYVDSNFEIADTFWYWIRALDYSYNASPWAPPDGMGGYVVPAWPGTATINEALVQLTADDRYTTRVCFIADSFTIKQPSEELGDKTIFAVGNVGGVPAIGLLANTFLDGFLIARMIAVEQIKAEHLVADEAVITGTAQLANAVVEEANIANLAVSTAKIADLAVVDAKIANLHASKITTPQALIDNLSSYSIHASKITGATLVMTGLLTTVGSWIGHVENAMPAKYLICAVFNHEDTGGSFPGISFSLNGVAQRGANTNGYGSAVIYMAFDLPAGEYDFQIDQFGLFGGTVDCSLTVINL